MVLDSDVGSRFILKKRGGKQMEYTVKQLANLSGVSSRTIRYYDKIDLLKPARLSRSRYRMYGEKEVSKLQQILFYREMALPLKTIKKIMDKPTFDEEKALEEHFVALRNERQRIDKLIWTVQRTLKEKRGELSMSDQEKFEAFKAKQVQENEEKFGKELEELYDEEMIQESNRMYESLTEEEMENLQKTAKQILEDLKEAHETGDPAGEKAQNVVKMHREWLKYTWPTYTKEMHR